MLTFAKSRNMLLCSTFVNVRSLKQQIFQIKWSYCTLVSVLGAENTTVNKTYPRSHSLYIQAKNAAKIIHCGPHQQGCTECSHTEVTETHLMRTGRWCLVWKPKAEWKFIVWRWCGKVRLFQEEELAYGKAKRWEK